MSASPKSPPTQNAAARRWMKSVTVAASSMPGVAAPWLVVLRVAIARAVTRIADIQRTVSRRPDGALRSRISAQIGPRAPMRREVRWSHPLPHSVWVKTKRIGSPRVSMSDTSWTDDACTSRCPTDPSSATTMPAIAIMSVLSRTLATRSSVSLIDTIGGRRTTSQSMRTPSTDSPPRRTAHRMNGSAGDWRAGSPARSGGCAESGSPTE